MVNHFDFKVIYYPTINYLLIVLNSESNILQNYCLKKLDVIPYYYYLHLINYFFMKLFVY